MRNKLNHLMVMFLLTGSITSVFGSNSKSEENKGKLDHYTKMIVSKYFNNVDDLINFELVCKKIRGNIDRFHFNPVSIKPSHLKFFTSLETLHLYNENDIAIWRMHRFKGGNKLFHAIEIHKNMKYTNAKILSNGLSKLTKDKNIIFHDISVDDKFFNECIEFNTNNGALNFKDITYNKNSADVKYIVKKIDANSFPKCINKVAKLENGRYRKTSYNINSIVVPTSVQIISYGAFRECSNLNQIVIPNSITHLDYVLPMWSLNDTFITVYTDNDYVINRMNQENNVNVVSSIRQTKDAPNDIFLNKLNYTNENDYPQLITSSFIENGMLNIKDLKRVPIIPFKGFSNNTELKSIISLKNILGICSSAFEFCKSLENVIIPSTVTKISNAAFKYCEQLSKVELHYGLKVLDDDCFLGCYNLTSIIIPSSVTRIGKSLFSYCSSLINVLIPDSVESIDSNSLFSSCINLKNVVLPTSISNIGWCTFCDCSSLTSVNIPENVINIYDCAFESCKSLTSIELPKTVTRINAGAFKGCVNLKEITLPDDIKTINVSTFDGCSNLSSINIPSKVTSIKNYAFRDCKGLINLDIGSKVRSLGLCYKSVPLNYAQYGQTIIRSNETFAGCDNCTFTVHNNKLRSILLKDGTSEQQIVKAEDYIDDSSDSEEEIYILTNTSVTDRSEIDDYFASEDSDTDDFNDMQ